MAYDAGCNFACGGSWEAPSNEFPNGRLIAGNGLVKGKKQGGAVRLTMLVAVSPENIACVITPRAGYPSNKSFCVTQVDNVTRDVKFDGGDGLVDQSFDFVFVKFGQPQQGT